VGHGDRRQEPPPCSPTPGTSRLPPWPATPASPPKRWPAGRLDATPPPGGADRARLLGGSILVTIPPPMDGGPLTDATHHLRAADQQITRGEYADAVREACLAIEAMRDLKVWPSRSPSRATSRLRLTATASSSTSWPPRRTATPTCRRCSTRPAATARLRRPARCEVGPRGRGRPHRPGRRHAAQGCRGDRSLTARSNVCRSPRDIGWVVAGTTTTPGASHCSSTKGRLEASPRNAASQPSLRRPTCAAQPAIRARKSCSQEGVAVSEPR
jgi:hypothetical protein